MGLYQKYRLRYRYFPKNLLILLVLFQNSHSGLILFVRESHQSTLLTLSEFKETVGVFYDFKNRQNSA